jgi:uncharacterized membrane protein
MSTRKKYFAVGVLIMMVTLICTAILYPHLPAQVPRHWDFEGHVNGWSSRTSAALVMPLSMIGVMALFAVLPWLSPRKFELDAQSTGYLWIMIGLLAFLGILHLAILGKAVGMRFDITRVILGLVCLFFAALSRVLPNLRRNFYVGVRTPWTLASDQVWRATHHFAAQTFLIGGVVGLALALIVPIVWLPIVMLGIGGLAPVIYSLVYYKQLEHRGQV